MPSSATTPVAARIPREQAIELREHAQRYGESVSHLVAGIIGRAMAGEQPKGGAPKTSPRSTSTLALDIFSPPKKKGS